MEGRKIRNMEEFATVAGISRPTISKYFNDPGSVKKSTRARIEAALEQYDYRPNIFAMNQNRRLTKNIGIVVPYLADPFFAEMARMIERRCIDAGFWPILLSSHGEQALENDALGGLQSLRVAGALIAPLGRRSDRAALERFSAEIPTVLFDNNTGLEHVGEAFVGQDKSQSMGLIVDYLCRTGSPPCFFEMRARVNPNANKVQRGYIEAMERLGHEPQLVQIDGEDWEFERIGFEGGLKVIEERRLPSETVLCSNDRLAMGLLTAAYVKGLRVGRGAGSALRIAGHDDHPFSRYTCPPLTTVAQEYVQIAERSVDTLFRLLEAGGRLETREVTRSPGRLVMRESA